MSAVDPKKLPPMRPVEAIATAVAGLRLVRDILRGSLQGVGGQGPERLSMLANRLEAERQILRRELWLVHGVAEEEPAERGDEDEGGSEEGWAKIEWCMPPRVCPRCETADPEAKRTEAKGEAGAVRFFRCRACGQEFLRVKKILSENQRQKLGNG